MKTLEDAWIWYNDVKKTLRRMGRIGSEKFWENIPWEDAPWKGDRHFSELTSVAIVTAAENAAQHLDDLAIVVLFSVFEANVRGAILEQLAIDEPKYQHRAVIDAVEMARERIEEGSFYAILSSFKGSDNDLIEEVNQVRKYRNWVSHGRRGAQPAVVIPPIARDRLERCMDLLFPRIPDDWIAGRGAPVMIHLIEALNFRCLPELEIWVWSSSPHVETQLGWTEPKPSLRDWLKDQGFLAEGAAKPVQPKEALEGALRIVRKPRSSAIYQALAEKVGLSRCTDPAFEKLAGILRAWFPRI